MSKEKDYIRAYEGAERRYFAGSEFRVEKRADEEDLNIVEGYAALFNKPTVIADWYREEILPGAFDDVLDDDVRCLFNHDPNFILARSNKGKGTLELVLDSNGLLYRYTTPDRQFARDLQDAIEQGDVTQSSFAFRPKETKWTQVEGEMDLRQIVKLERLYDVSPVTYPAYTDTTVAKRSHDAFLTEMAKNIETRTDEAPGDEKTVSLREAQIIINENLQRR